MVQKSRIQHIKGYKIETPDILTYVQENIHPLMTSVYKKLAYSTVLREVSEICDMGSTNSKDNMFHIAWLRWDETQKKFGQYHTLNDPLRFTISVGRDSSGKILATTYHANNSEYDEAIISLPEVTDYSWSKYPNTELISIKDNRQRYDGWKTLISEDDNFSSLMEYKLGMTDPFKTWIQEKDNSLRFALQPDPIQRLKDSFKNEVMTHLLKLDRIALKNYFSTSNQINQLMDEIPVELLGVVPRSFESIEDFYKKEELYPSFNDETIQHVIDRFTIKQ